MQPLLTTYKPLLHSVLRHAWILYGVLTLVVATPLLQPGYILTLDMVFTPSLRMPTVSSNDYLFRVLLSALHYLFASDTIEKIILCTVLLLSGVGMHRLVRYIDNLTTSLYAVIGAYVAGTLYMINPFTYDRFMAGQYEVLLGYALLPWFIRLLLTFLDNPTWIQALQLSACTLAISIVSIHDIGIMALLAIITSGVVAGQRYADIEWRTKAWKLGMYTLGICMLSSSYWVIPLILGKSSVATQVASISVSDQSAFATVGDSNLGRLSNVVRLQGFWAESRNMYIMPQSRVAAWGLTGLIIWALIVTGAISLWRSRQRTTVTIFALSAGAGCLLAVGVLNGWLTQHIPFLAGYREPEKFVAIIALTYAAFISRGTATTLAYCRTQGGKVFSTIVAVAVILLPLAWTPTMLYGFAGQLKPVWYPSDWSAINSRLKTDPSNFQTLFLPWHLYMRFGFEGRIIANPAKAFFSKPVIVSDNTEFQGAAPSNPTATKRSLDRLLPGAAHTPNLDTLLAALNIKYIILDHSDGYQEYAYLTKLPSMKLVEHGATLDLYQNKAY